jgi:hypothetical protein
VHLHNRLSKAVSPFRGNGKEKKAILTSKANRMIAAKDSPSLLCIEAPFFFVCLYNKEKRTHVEN